MDIAFKESTLTPEMIKWLAFGKRDAGSNTMFTRMTGVNALGGDPPGYPRDPKGLHRCVLLLRAVPSFRALLPKMATLSPHWGELVRNWDRLESSVIGEVGLKWEVGETAPNTQALITRVLS
jgi:hypothetical protein